MESWMPIKEYPNYEVSDMGRVRNSKTNHVLRPKNNDPYFRVTLYNKNGHSDKLVHRLVAETFCGYSPSLLDVNHKDGCKRNNNFENLEFCTRSENIQHAYDIGLKKPSGAHPIRKVKILETGEIYESVRECARCIGGDYRHIIKCLRGERDKHLGYHFVYAE